MEKLTPKKRLQVVYLYFCGLSNEQIAAKTGISKGSVANIIGELKAGNFQEAADVTGQIEILRDLAVDLAKLKLPAGQAAVGIAVLKRMYELGLDPSDMERWPLLLNSIKSQDDAQELIQAAYAVRDIQQESGLSLPALENKVKQLGEKAKELDTVTAKVGEAKGQIVNLNTQKDKLTTEVTSLDDKFKWLVPRVQELEQREKLLLDRHKSMLEEEKKAEQTLSTLKSELKNLEKAGLSFQELIDFAKKLKIVAKSHGLKPPAVRDRLLHELTHLNKGLGLETLANQQKQILKETNQSIDKRKGELTSCEEALKSLQQQKLNLEASIRELAKVIRIEMEQIALVAQNMVKQMGDDLKGGCAETLSAVHQLREESIKVGQEIGQYEGILKESRWVGKLMALLNSGENIGASDVRTIALSVNRGICAWLGQQGGKSPQVEFLALNLSKYVQELEGWRPQG